MYLQDKALHEKYRQHQVVSIPGSGSQSVGFFGRTSVVLALKTGGLYIE